MSLNDHDLKRGTGNKLTKHSGRLIRTASPIIGINLKSSQRITSEFNFRGWVQDQNLFLLGHFHEFVQK